MLSRTKVILLLSLIFVSLVATLPILQPTNVRAVNLATGLTYDEGQIKSWLYYNAIAYCMTKYLSSEPVIHADDAANGKWFGKTSANTGLYLTGFRNTGDEILCSDASFIKAALSLWGLSPADVLCSSLFLRQNAAHDTISCRTGITDFYHTVTNQDSSDHFKEYIRNTIYGGKEPTLTEPQKYLFYRKSVQYGCIPGINTKPYIDASFSGGGFDTYTGVKWVDLATGELFTDGVYNKENSPNNTFRNDTKWVSADIGVMNCGNIVQTMSDLAEAYSKWALTNPKLATDVAANANLNKDGTTTCAIDGIGWIICPVMKFMAGVVDEAYKIVSNLLIAPALSTDTSDTNDTYKAWSAMRSIANVAFVIAFLIIIFSQLTSVGITNYGIKKMLPRLIIAAILVNLSYFICTIAVDISNILGSSLIQFFDSIGGKIAGPAFTTTVAQTGDGWAGIVGGILATTVAVAAITGIALYAGLSILLPALISALFAIVTVFLVLTLRQALIIILIVVSPLAFVAFLLPNTENLFKKWQSLLTTLLLMFPIIAVIFGASALASQVVMTSSENFFVQVMGALIAIIPLFITPVVMKSAGTLLNQFSGMINGATKGARGRMDKGAEELKKRDMTRLDNAAMNSKNRFNPRRGFLRYRSRTGAIDQNQQTELNRAKVGYVASEMGTNADLVDKMSQGGGPGAESRAKARALTELSKLNQEEVASEVIRMTDASRPEDMLADANTAFIDAAQKGEKTRLQAAQSILLKTSAGRDMLHNTLLANTGGSMTAIDNNSEMSKAFKNDLNAAGLKGSDAGLARLGFKSGTLSDLDTLDPDTYKLNDTEIVGQTEAGLRRVIAAGHLGSETATRILASDTLKTTEEQRRILINEAHGTLPPQQGSGSNGPTYPNSGTGTIGFGQGNN